MITIYGRPISKKNSKRVFTKNFRIVVLPSEAYMAFEESVLSQLKDCTVKFEGPVHIDYDFAFKGKMETDIDNAISGINDILEKSGIIDNDKNIKSGTFRVQGNYSDWKTIIKIRKL